MIKFWVKHDNCWHQLVTTQRKLPLNWAKNYNNASLATTNMQLKEINHRERSNCGNITKKDNTSWQHQQAPRLIFWNIKPARLFIGGMWLDLRLPSRCLSILCLYLVTKPLTTQSIDKNLFKIVSNYRIFHWFTQVG